MASDEIDKEREIRRKKLRVEFSNHENSVTLIGSLEAWFDYRWGKKGRINAGLLDYFNRFPCDGKLTPDFEVRFHTPYTIWGECKKQVNRNFPDDVKQLIDYALRCESYETGSYDVVVLGSV